MRAAARRRRRASRARSRRACSKARPAAPRRAAAAGAPSPHARFRRERARRGAFGGPAPARRAREQAPAAVEAADPPSRGRRPASARPGSASSPRSCARRRCWARCSSAPRPSRARRRAGRRMAGSHFHRELLDDRANRELINQAVKSTCAGARRLEVAPRRRRAAAPRTIPPCRPTLARSRARWWRCGRGFREPGQEGGGQ